MRKVLCKEFAFSGHALRRMFERGINTDQVTGAVRNGEVIAS